MREIHCPRATDLTGLDDDGRHVGSATLLADGWRVYFRRNVVGEAVTRAEAESLIRLHGAKRIVASTRRKPYDQNPRVQPLGRNDST